MKNITIIKHSLGAPLLRLVGVGPHFIPVNALNQIQNLLQKNSFWAINRDINDLKKMLKNSSIIITLWKNRRLVGFGRATSDWTYRAVLWDVIIDKQYQNIGLGKLLVNTILEANAIKNVEKVYLMTTNSKEFYKSCGFEEMTSKYVLVTSRKEL